MATVPVEITWVTGQVVTAAQLNANLRDAVNFMLAPPLAIMRQTAAGAFANSTWTSVALDTEDIDRDGGHSNVTNNSRYTAQTQGYYLAGGKISFASNVTNRRWTRWAVNGTEVSGSRISVQAANGDSTEVPAASRWVFLNVGDYLELQGFQDSGGSINTVVANSSDQPFVNVQWMST
jgi:hypothetical protein